MADLAELREDRVCCDKAATRSANAAIVAPGTAYSATFVQIRAGTAAAEPSCVGISYTDGNSRRNSVSLRMFSLQR